jgi:glycosyltransferase involved in cell wall biosynthesis
MKGKNPALSLCMIVKNEARNLSRSLGPLSPYFDEVVVVDTGSTDETALLAKQYGAKVCEVPWRNDFSFARNHSIEQASGDWILWFDADNRMEIQEVQKIRNLIDDQPDKIFWCTEVVEPGGDQLIQKRIFPNRPDFRFAGTIHEQLIHPKEGIRYVWSDIKIYHWGYVDKELLKEKTLRNLGLLQEELRLRPDDFFCHFNIARCYANLREFGKAMAHLEQVIHNPAAREENPDIYFYSFILIFLFLGKMGKGWEGHSILNRLREENPRYGLAWFYSGRWHFQEGEAQQAIQELMKFQELGISAHSIDLPRQKMLFESYYWLGQCYEKSGEPLLARVAYERSLDFEPGNSHVYLKLASLCKHLGQGEEEKSFLRKCLELHPGNRNARAAFNQVAAPSPFPSAPQTGKL